MYSYPKSPFRQCFGGLGAAQELFLGLDFSPLHLGSSSSKTHEEGRPSWPRASGTSSVVGATVAKLVDEARLPEFTEESAAEDTDVSEALRFTLSWKTRNAKQPEDGGFEHREVWLYISIAHSCVIPNGIRIRQEKDIEEVQGDQLYRHNQPASDILQKQGVDRARD